jgi:hypothetical protein
MNVRIPQARHYREIRGVDEPIAFAGLLMWPNFFDPIADDNDVHVFVKGRIDAVPQGARVDDGVALRYGLLPCQVEWNIPPSGAIDLDRLELAVRHIKDCPRVAAPRGHVGGMVG